MNESIAPQKLGALTRDTVSTTMFKFFPSIQILLNGLCLFASSSSALVSFPSNIKLELLPSCLECQSVHIQYPVTLLSKLFSSVPKREFAIENVTLKTWDNSGTRSRATRVIRDDAENFNHLNFNLLVGRSASGKSSLLRILSGDEKPLSGKVLLNGLNMYDECGLESLSPKPIMLDSKPDCFDDRSTVIEKIMSSYRASINKVPILSKLDVTLVERLGREYASILNLSEEELEGVPSDLSPSGQYLFGLVLACMESSASTAQMSELSQENDGGIKVEVSLPVLLLDELLDCETSIVANKVGEGLRNLTRRGGIVLAATHRPEYLSSVADRIIMMSGGKVLSVNNCARM